MRRALGAVTVLAVAACTAHAPVRSTASGATAIDTSVSQFQDPAARARVSRAAVERHADFSLAFVEFDDQGRLWSRDEIDLLDETLAEQARLADGAGVAVIAFAHGWRHGADVCDPFVACFRSLLAQIQGENVAAARLSGARPPRLVGVYCAWRGRSVTVPAISALSFWARKRAAERIGAGELVEVLAHLDGFVRRENAEGRYATLTVVGHSLGGTMVYTALANVLKARLVEAWEKRGQASTGRSVISGFGNLVVLVNPALEASAYAPLHDLVDALGSFSPRQTPILVVVGSEGDFPNRVWFRLGRKLDILTQHAGPRSPRDSLTTAVGDYEPFTTHRLEAVGSPEGGATGMRVEGCLCRLPIGHLPEAESRRLAEFFRTRRPGGIERSEEACAAGLTLGAARLTCRAGVSPARPVWNVRATDEVVHGHAGFYTTPFIDFLRYLILDSISHGMGTARAE